MFLKKPVTQSNIHTNDSVPTVSCLCSRIDTSEFSLSFPRYDLSMAWRQTAGNSCVDLPKMDPNGNPYWSKWTQVEIK